jgi:hypothetical protein
MNFYDYAEAIRADCGGEYHRIADLYADDGPVAGNATASHHSVCAPLLNLGAAPALPRNTPVWRKDCRHKLLEHADLYSIERCDQLRLEFGVNSDVGVGLDFVTYHTEGDWIYLEALGCAGAVSVSLPFLIWVFPPGDHHALSGWRQ